MFLEIMFAIVLLIILIVQIIYLVAETECPSGGTITDIVYCLLMITIPLAIVALVVLLVCIFTPS